MRIDSIGDSWESLKARCKSLKSGLDRNMQELGRLNGTLSSSLPGAPDRLAVLDGQITVVAGLKDDIERGLGDFSEASDALVRVAAPGPQAAQAARFQETHQELTRDFRRVAQSIDHLYQHARLLPRGGKSKGDADDAEAGLLKEHSALDATLSMTDDVTANAAAVRDMLTNQRTALGGVAGKVGGMSSKFPGIDQLIGKISDRKTKEQLVLAFTVACCCCFTIWYKFL